MITPSKSALYVGSINSNCPMVITLVRIESYQETSSDPLLMVSVADADPARYRFDSARLTVIIELPPLIIETLSLLILAMEVSTME